MSSDFFVTHLPGCSYSLSLARQFRCPSRQRRDLDDPIVEQRLKAKKAITIIEANSEKLEETLAAQAWAVAEKGKAPIRCIVFCNEREMAEKRANMVKKEGGPKEGRSRPNWPSWQRLCRRVTPPRW